MATITSVDHIGSLEIARDHAAYFSAGAKADHAAYGGIDVAEWVMPEYGSEYGSVGQASWTAEGVVAERVDDWV